MILLRGCFYFRWHSSELSSLIEVTNTSNILADSAGSTYNEGESVETVIRDILAPDDAGIEFYDLEIRSGNGALTGEYIVYTDGESIQYLLGSKETKEYQQERGFSCSQ